MIMMSIDYGDVKTGLAICDESETLAFPLTVLKETNPIYLAEKISALAVEKSVRMIVIGYPKNMDGSEGFKAQSVKEFVKTLNEKIDLPIRLWDERLTTVLAHRFLSENNVRGKNRKDVVDAVAAVIILQSYIEYRKNEV